MKLRPPLAWSHRLYSWLEQTWAAPRVQRGMASLLLATFVVTLLLIELKRQAVLNIEWIPSNHFHAVRLGFNLLLVVEVIGLVFGLSGSVGRTMGKQFEILSLILLRQSLKELVHASEPIRWDVLRPFVPTMAADAVAAVAVFALVGLFYRLQHEGDVETGAEADELAASKEVVALLVLVIFVVLGVQSVSQSVSGIGDQAAYDLFFDSLYTVLVFADLIIVFLSLRHSFTYEDVFRNSGYAVVTVLIRIGLTAPPFLNAAIGVGATLLGVALAAAFPRTAEAPRPPEHGSTTSSDTGAQRG